MRWFCLAVCFGLGLNLRAGPGSVRAVDGRTILGDIRLTNGWLLVASTNAEPVRFAPADLLAVQFNESDTEAGAPGGKGNGLLGFYFGNTNLDGSVVVRLDETIDFDWGTGAPIAGMAADYFGVVWSGEIEAPAAGEFTFIVAAEEAAQLMLSDRLIADASAQRHGAEAASPPISLESGKRYPLKLTYFDWTGAARVRLQWQGPGLPKSVIPRERLFAKSLRPDHTADVSARHGLLGTYYKDAAFSGATTSRIDPTIDFNWSEREPLPGFSRTNLSVRWSGQVKADYSEEYTFYVFANDGVRLWVDDKLLIDRAEQSWVAENLGSLPLVAGEKYDLRLQLQSRSAGAAARLMWSSASISKTNIPATHLFPSRPAPSRASGSNAVEKTPPGVVLRDGTFLAGTVEQATETLVRASGLLKNNPLSTIQVARIVCQPLSKTMEARISAGRQGVLLAKGDFADGNFRGIANGQIRISSVLFGTRSFDAKKEALAVVLREVAPASTTFEIRLRDQSVLPAVAVTFERDGLGMESAILGVRRLSVDDLSALIRRSPAGGKK
jgi:hypothetical protein